MCLLVDRNQIPASALLQLRLDRGRIEPAALRGAENGLVLSRLLRTGDLHPPGFVPNAPRFELLRAERRLFALLRVTRDRIPHAARDVLHGPAPRLPPRLLG